MSACECVCVCVREREREKGNLKIVSGFVDPLKHEKQIITSTEFNPEKLSEKRKEKFSLPSLI